LPDKSRLQKAGMTMKRREVLTGALAASLVATARAHANPDTAKAAVTGPRPDPTEFIDLWPGEAPGMPALAPAEIIVDRSTDPDRPDRFVNGIIRPRLAIFRPTVSNGAALLIIPGGGFQRISFDNEGYDPGHWFAAHGFTTFILFYRLPGEGWADGPNVPLSDAQRAMRVIRDRAGDYAIDPQRVAAMGFSAGGHVCADLATRFDVRTYDPVDKADGASARPLLAAPIYPVISMTLPLAHAGSRELLIGADAGPDLERAHSPQHNVPPDAPPCFLLHAEDDGTVAVGNTLEFRAALRAQGIPVETHLFAHGGHGFGLHGVAGMPAQAWPELFVSWAQSMELF
jgi:acetyl esterase/lipase